MKEKENTTPSKFIKGPKLQFLSKETIFWSLLQHCMLEFGHVVINQDFGEVHLLAGRQHLNLGALHVESEPVLWIAVLVW